MAIIVTLPCEAPTGIVATLVEGGNLAPNTTYYYVMFSSDRYNSPGGNTRFAYHSPLSVEGSFTTTTTAKSVSFTWDRGTETTYYNFLLTTISGYYENSRVYGGLMEEMNTAINQTTESYLITEPDGDNPYVKHSAQLVNNFVGDIPKETGVLKVYFDGTSSTTWNINHVYDAIIAAGYGDYARYDGYTFILKGWIVVDAVSTGHLVVEQKNLIFIKGGVHNWSTTFITRFGRWVDDIWGANYDMGCDIDIQSCRYPFRGGYDTFQVYGCQVSQIKSRLKEFSENLTTYYYNDGQQQYFAFYVSEIKDNILGMNLRGTTGDIVDLKFGQGNNFGNDNHIRCKVTNIANLPYYKGGKFYATSFLQNTALRAYGGHATNGYWCDFFDCVFPNFDNGEVNVGDIYYSMYSLDCDRHEDFYYSIKTTVLDKLGVPIEGVKVNIVNKDGGAANWIEKDGTYNELITGNSYLGDVQTDSDGKTDYYTMSYKFFLEHQEEIIQYNYNLTKEVYYPFTVTFSKDGYRDYTIKINQLNEKIESTITLEETEPPIFYQYSIEGTVNQQSISGEVIFNSIEGYVETTINQEVISGDIIFNKIQGHVEATQIINGVVITN